MDGGVEVTASHNPIDYNDAANSFERNPNQLVAILVYMKFEELAEKNIFDTVN